MKFRLFILSVFVVLFCLFAQTSNAAVGGGGTLPYNGVQAVSEFSFPYAVKDGQGGAIFTYDTFTLSVLNILDFIKFEDKSISFEGDVNFLPFGDTRICRVKSDGTIGWDKYLDTQYLFSKTIANVNINSKSMVESSAGYVITKWERVKQPSKLLPSGDADLSIVTYEACLQKIRVSDGSYSWGASPITLPSITTTSTGDTPSTYLEKDGNGDAFCFVEDDVINKMFAYHIGELGYSTPAELILPTDYEFYNIDEVYTAPAEKNSAWLIFTARTPGYYDDHDRSAGNLFAAKATYDGSGSVTFGTPIKLAEDMGTFNFYQLAPNKSIASDGNGGFVITWTGSGMQIVYAQYLTSSGTLPWGSTPKIIKAAGTSMDMFPTATVGNGNVLFTWTGAGLSGIQFGLDIYAQSLNLSTGLPSSVGWMTNKKLTTGLEFFSSASYDGSGGFFVTFHSLKNEKLVVKTTSLITEMINALTSGTIPTNIDVNVLKLILNPLTANTDLYGQHLNSSGTNVWGNSIGFCRAPNFQYSFNQIDNATGQAMVYWFDTRYSATKETFTHFDPPLRIVLRVKETPIYSAIITDSMLPTVEVTKINNRTYVSGYKMPWGALTTMEGTIVTDKSSVTQGYASIEVTWQGKTTEGYVAGGTYKNAIFKAAEALTPGPVTFEADIYDDYENYISVEGYFISTVEPFSVDNLRIDGPLYYPNIACSTKPTVFGRILSFNGNLASSETNPIYISWDNGTNVKLQDLSGSTISKVSSKEARFKFSKEAATLTEGQHSFRITAYDDFGSSVTYEGTVIIEEDKLLYLDDSQSVKTYTRGPATATSNPTILYNLASPGTVVINVYSPRGEIVQSIVQGSTEVGLMEVEVRFDDGLKSRLGRGIYPYNIIVNGKMDTKAKGYIVVK